MLNYGQQDNDMLDNRNEKQTVYLEVESHICQWLERRQSLLVSFCEFSEFDESLPPSLENLTRLNEFCSELVDYISTGHFEMYEKLLKEAQLFGDEHVSLMSDIYPKITVTTEKFVALDAKFDGKQNLSMKDIKSALSEAGEILDQRLLLEDQLIQLFHKSHSLEVETLSNVMSA